MQRTFTSWQKHVERLAASYEADVVSNPRIFERYKDIVTHNSNVDFPNGARFHVWVERNHYYALLAAIRKIFLGTLADEISLIKIINGLIAMPSFTFDSYQPLVSDTPAGLIALAGAKSASERFFLEDGSLNFAKLTQDKDALQAIKRRLKFINETVLHLQEFPTATNPSDAELKKIIKELGDLLQEYRLFLTGASVAWSIANLAWVDVFTIPWIVKEED